MALTQRLQIRPSQALVMTPQLMQAIKLLQLSNLELAAYVEAELERNPLLERGVDSESAPGGDAMPAARAEEGDSAAAEFADSGGEESETGLVDRSMDDASLDDGAPARSRPTDLPAGYSEWAAVPAGPRAEGDYNLESFLSAEPTLADWLREQVTFAITDPARRMIGYYLVDLVDESGYVVGDLA